MTVPENSCPEPEGLVEPVNRLFHIPVATRIVNVLKNTRVTPNQVTYASVLFGVASGLAFSQGESGWFIIAGIFLETSLILDCADGQLARAKHCATDFGRLLDGIGGYIAYLSMIGGMMVGLQNQFYPLLAITAIAILKAIAFDYLKLSISTMILEGVDGSKRDIRKAYQDIQEASSKISKVYFYYLQFQQLIFQGKWESLNEYSNKKINNADEIQLTGEQRKKYFQNIQTLLEVWKWNGHEMVLFLIAFFSIIGIIGASLTFLASFAGIQFCLTFIYHHYILRHEVCP